MLMSKKKQQQILQLRKEASGKIDLFNEVYERYNFCLTTIIQNANANLTLEDFSLLQKWLLSSDSDQDLGKKLQLELQNIRTELDKNKFSDHIDQTCTDLTQRIVTLSKYF